MPFEPAKAVAATFCWNIRYALTPLFGVEFLSLCIPPDDVRFGRMTIDPAIVQAATITVNKYRHLELNKTRMAGMGGAGTPYGLITKRSGQQAGVKILRPKPAKNRVIEEIDVETENDTDTSEKRHYPPSTLLNSGWTPANVSRVSQQMKWPAIRNPPQKNTPIPSPRDIMASITRLQHAPRPNRHGDIQHPHGVETEEADDGDISDSNDSASEAGVLGSTAGGNIDSDVDGDSLTDSDTSTSNAKRDNNMQEKPPCNERKHSPLPLTNDARAAYMLMKLHVQEVVEAPQDQNRKRRRASA